MKGDFVMIYTKIKRKIAVCMSVAMLAGCVQPINIGISCKVSANEAVGDYLVYSPSDTKLDQIADQYESKLSDDVVDIQNLQQNNILKVELTADQAAKLDQNKNVIIEKDTMMTSSSDSETVDRQIKHMAAEQWNRKALQAENITTGKDTVKVAVLDSGIDKTSDIVLEDAVNFVPDQGVDDQTGHGTIVSNLLAKSDETKDGIITTGDNIKLSEVRVLDENNQAPVSRVVEGLQWCIDHQIDIVNMSFGMDSNSQVLHQVIQQMQEKGILMIAAAGNNGEQAGAHVQYPAAYSEVIGVGSVDENLSYSSFSAKGDQVELMAPGENIPITTYWDIQGVGSGTSYAAPQVTAIAAALWSRNKDRSAQDIRGILTQSARRITGGESGRLVSYKEAAQIFDEYNGDAVTVAKAEWCAEDYEVPELLKASWSGKNHNKYVKTASLNKTEIGVVQNACEYADVGGDEFKKADVLHARAKTNYVSACKCLYQAALSWNSKRNYNDLYKIADSYKSSWDTNSASSIKDLKTAMKAAVYYDLQDMSKTGTKVSVNRGRLQLLGLAIHVAGDTYAHKAMVDVTDGGKELDTIYAKHLNNIKPYLVKPAQGMTPIINKAKSSEGLTTAHLGQNYFKNDKVSKKRANDYYTDSITYMAKRYSVATQVATGKLLNYYNNKANFSIFVFCPYELKKKGNQTYASIYNYKLLKLTQNVQDAGYRYADYSTGKNNTYNTSDWSRLSHN